MNETGTQLAALRRARPKDWEREVRRQIKRAPTLAAAALAMGISRNSMRRWCRELGIPHGKDGNPAFRSRVA